MTDMKVLRITEEENDAIDRAEKIIKLTTRSGVQFLINLQTAKVSKTIATMLESLDGVGCESFESGASISSTPILIDCPHTDVLGKVLEWARHHRVSQTVWPTSLCLKRIMPRNDAITSNFIWNPSSR